MNFMNLFKVSCSEVKVHLDMFLTHHVQFHRRLSDPAQKKETNSLVTTLHPNVSGMDQINQQYDHQQNLNEIVVHNNPQIPQEGDVDDPIDDIVIEQIANQIKDFADRFNREHSRNKILKTIAENVPTIAVCCAAAFVVVQCARR